jgi:hypothetical protein
MQFSEFLRLTSTIKMLYGREIAEKFFTSNIEKYYDLNNASLLNLSKEKNGESLLQI